MVHGPTGPTKQEGEVDILDTIEDDTLDDIDYYYSVEDYYDD